MPNSRKSSAKRSSSSGRRSASRPSSSGGALQQEKSIAAPSAAGAAKFLVRREIVDAFDIPGAPIYAEALREFASRLTLMFDVGPETGAGFGDSWDAFLASKMPSEAAGLRGLGPLFTFCYQRLVATENSGSLRALQMETARYQEQARQQQEVDSLIQRIQGVLNASIQANPMLSPRNATAAVPSLGGSFVLPREGSTVTSGTQQAQQHPPSAASASSKSNGEVATEPNSPLTLTGSTAAQPAIPVAAPTMTTAQKQEVVRSAVDEVVQMVERTDRSRQLQFGGASVASLQQLQGGLRRLLLSTAHASGGANSPASSSRRSGAAAGSQQQLASSTLKPKQQPQQAAGPSDSTNPHAADDSTAAIKHNEIVQSLLEQAAAMAATAPSAPTTARSGKAGRNHRRAGAQPVLSTTSLAIDLPQRPFRSPFGIRPLPFYRKEAPATPRVVSPGSRAHRLPSVEGARSPRSARAAAGAGRTEEDARLFAKDASELAARFAAARQAVSAMDDAIGGDDVGGVSSW